MTPSGFRLSLEWLHDLKGPPISAVQSCEQHRVSGPKCGTYKHRMEVPKTHRRGDWFDIWLCARNLHARKRIYKTCYVCLSGVKLSRNGCWHIFCLLFAGVVPISKEFGTETTSSVTSWEHLSITVGSASKGVFFNLWEPLHHIQLFLNCFQRESSRDCVKCHWNWPSLF